jgi:hypothetical protein
MDVLNLLLPFLAVWAYLRVYEPALKPNRLFWLLVSAFCLGLFAYTWLYWWFALLVLIIYEAYAVLELLFSRRRNQPEAVSLGYRLSNLFFLCLFTALWVGLLCGRQPFLSFYAQLRQVLVLNKPVAAAVWPNVFTTIAEFRQLSFSQIAQLIGGLRLLVVSWLCLAGLFLYNQRLKGARREAVLLFTVWFLAMLFACRQGIRFVLFLLLPLGIALGWAAEELYRYLRLRRKKALSLLVLALVFALGLNTLGNGWQAARNIYPLMHDSWYKLLLALRQDSAKEAVINAWWDFGDWLKTVAQRRVIFDGQSQHLPQAYWMARVLFSQGEEEAMAILRMLNNAGNQAFELLDGYYADSFKAITFLNKLLSLPLAEARQALKALPAELARREEEILFQQPVEAYFIVDYSLLAKAGPISYLANWDFNRLYLLVKPGQAREQLASEGLSAGQIESLTKESSLMGPADIEDWVSQKVHFYSRLLKGSVREELVLFGGGLFYYPRQDTVYLYSCPEDKFKKPRSLFIFSGDAYREINYADSELDFSVLIFKDDADNYCALMLDRGLAKSLLVRLYFLEGRGLRHFRSFAAERLAASDKYIRAFKIAW